MKKILLILWMLWVANVNATVVKIGLFRNISTSSLQINYGNLPYKIMGDSINLGEIENKQMLRVYRSGDKIKIKYKESNLGTFTTVKLFSSTPNTYLSIKSLSPVSKQKSFMGSLLFTVEGDGIKVVNHVEIEDYIAGVIESEAGSSEPLEYYKIQAIISRTYALSHLYKHAEEGFNLCDQVHCQVYKSRVMHNNEIITATKATEGLVLVDSDINLITASFHSNCGGQTTNSADVWSKQLPYLCSVTDTFCLNQPHATWKKEIPKAKWLTYLENKYNYPTDDSVEYQKALFFKQEFRDPYFADSIQLKEIRTDWHLRSTYFDISDNNIDNSIVLSGKGFGHGVGLCQEGAMRMAELGYDYLKILRFYYKEVHLINLSMIDFYREE